jgi:predicted TIM-barrel fold metal-dependent hydrolase
MTQERCPEPILEPDLPIVDAHHHLWFMPESAVVAMERHPGVALRALGPVVRRNARYLFDEYKRDIESGHNIRATVFVDAHAMYRATGSEALRSVGEVEFVNGVAAMAASGLFGDAKVCAGIVGGVDLTLGAAVEEVLAAHIQAAGGRYRGVRSSIVYDEELLGADFGTPHRLLDARFRAGFQRLEHFGLSFEAWLLEPQLPELVELTRNFPNTRIILNHVGAPVGLGRHAGRREERFSLWRESIRALARHENVAVKLGGLGIPFGGFRSYLATPPLSSAELAAEWKPYIEACIEAFGPQRAMFESNFPVDSAVGSYATVWNAFKRIVAGASADEKTALFSGTAARIYRLEI